eukprot:CAMPEP_0116021428 /NCGR_PEP_ID=MMETSP0321-20121206/10381_1 /TAXON_ID=163516 /ORGANISM="Leptocylindrus danicus var. danicus, Strain B650" /LENGTH=63 /DNA_ID=CAMNT_0003492297 /DNA_START=637 /DNA_END=828 /DNA_ORIENTATION=-
MHELAKRRRLGMRLDPTATIKHQNEENAASSCAYMFGEYDAASQSRRMIEISGGVVVSSVGGA